MSPDFPKIEAWHVCVSGYTQHIGQLTGLARLWAELHRQHAGPTAVVALHEWNSNFERIAESIELCSMLLDEPPAINVYAYSWGAGWGFLRFAEALQRRGLKINHAILSDPVYRSVWAAFRYRSLIGHPQIVVPANVENVRWFRQHTNKPAGHDLVAADPRRTNIAPPLIIPGVVHAYMDDLPEFHDAAEHAADLISH